MTCIGVVIKPTSRNPIKNVCIAAFPKYNTPRNIDSLLKCQNNPSHNSYDKEYNEILFVIQLNLTMSLQIIWWNN